MTSDALWQDGWYRFARHQPSPNFGLRPAGDVFETLATV